ncbi:hook domain-containing protein [Thraustotheca clavata]|uniref:Hook domain-containing protein n=1 Tax=Thraustotheca clavata TaxID=74557 RepID=A0A1W0ABI2_9STRA|nr:hook domain-containing protein [Thraustotheca clavata]
MDALSLDDDKRSALLEWLQTFVVDEDVASGCDVADITWSKLADGIFLGRVMNRIDSDYMDKASIREDEDMTWIIKSANFNALARAIETFYMEELSVRCDVATYIDLNGISRTASVDMPIINELGKLAALILYCAVNCQDRQTFVMRIVSLEERVQLCVMSLIEQLTTAFPPLSPTGGRHSNAFSPSSTPTAAATADMTPLRGYSSANTDAELNEIKERLMATEMKWQDAEQDKRRITEEYEKLSIDFEACQARVTSLEEENHRLNIERQQSIARDNKKLEELVNAEKHSLTVELQVKTEELNYIKKESTERMMVLEHEVRRQADELDIARSKLVALAKLESSVAKYKQKVEEMNALKQHSLEVEAQNVQYLERVVDLESTIKTMPTLKLAIEKYKNQVVELETANVEAMSSLQIKEYKVRQLQEELETALHGKEFLEHQLEELRANMPDENSSDVGAYTSAADVLGGTMQYREQIVRLEHENKLLKEQLQSSSQSEASSSSSAGPSGELILLQHERDDALRMKLVWQEKAAEHKRKYEELLDSMAQKGEANVTAAQLAQVEATNTRLAAQLQAHEEQARKLAHNIEESDSLRATISELTNRLKEKESTINNLAQDKEKLETYTKKTLHAVQSKYMVAMSTHRNQLAEKQAKVDLLETKLKDLKAIQKREQSLLMSSFYEIGGEMQRRTMMPQQSSNGAAAVAAAQVPPLAAWLPNKRSDNRATKRQN